MSIETVGLRAAYAGVDMRKIALWFVVFGSSLLAACGGGDAFVTPNSPQAPGTSTVAAITVVSSAPTILSDGSAPAIVTALARDASNNLVAGVTVTFTATSGGIAVTQAVTDAAGEARATLSTAGDPTLRTITVTARATATLSSTVNVQVVSGSANNSVQMGRGTGAAFVAGQIAISNPALSAGGSTSLQVVLQQSDGTLYTQSASVSFSSTCAATGLATVPSPVVTTTGIVSTTYAATGCSGADVISATATINGSPLSATGTVTVAAAAIGSISFESATPTNVALRGTGVPGRPETSTVVFRVLDQTGGARANANVQFALNTTVGGITLTPTTATSDANGRVQTVVNAGTVNTTVRVTATVLNTTPTISTQSNQLTITTGIPDQDSVSVAALCPNAEAWNIDGTTMPVTVRLADRFNNPVPDGTAVTFSTEGGRIQPQCTTVSNATESGFCVVNWTSSNPRPVGGLGQSGRATILATAIGEESFTDNNGNGTFDNGESFVDLAERFRDENENGAYDFGEQIYDFNNNSTRDPADGFFNGVLCQDNTGRCNANVKTTGIGASTLIVMSGSTPDRISPSPGTPVNFLAKPGNANISIRVADINDNPMPAGTIVSATVSGSGLTVPAPNSFTIPCTTTPTTYSFTITANATATSGTLTISVKTLGAAGVGGVESIIQYPVNVP